MTPQRSDDDKQAIEWVRTLGLYSYSLIFVIAGALLVLSQFSDRFRSVFALQGPLPIVFFSIARIALIVAVIVLVVQWIAHTWNEFGLWARYLDFVFIGSSANIAIVLLAVALGVLIVLTYDVVLFSAYFSLFMFVDYWSQWVSNDYFETALARTRLLNDADPAALNVLEVYWLKRPQLARIVTVMFVSLIAFATALAGRYSGSHYRLVIEAAMYVLQALNIAVAETIITIWRLKRDNDMKALVSRV